MKTSDQFQKVLNIGMLQFDIQWEQAAINLRKIEKLAAPHLQDVDLLILPEAFTTGFSVKKFPSEPFEKSTSIQWMKDFSEKHKVAICGSLFIEEDGGIYNRFIWIDETQIRTYNKRHLFSIGGEDKNFSKGSERVIIDYKGWKIMPQICYDLRFPVWSRNDLNYDLLINVANWPASRNKVWKTLLKARALENQSFAIGVNRVGDDAMDISYKGNSMVIDARGNNLAKAGNKEKYFTVQLDLDQLRDLRKKFNSLIDGDEFSIKK